MTNTGLPARNHDDDTAAIIEQIRRKHVIESVNTSIEKTDATVLERLNTLENRVDGFGQSQEYVTPKALAELFEALEGMRNRLSTLENAPKDITPRTDTSELEQLIKQLNERISRLESEPKNDGPVNARSSDEIAALESRIDNLADILGENSAASLNNASLVLKELQSLRDRVNAMEGRNQNIKAEILTMLMQEYASMRAELQGG